MKSQALLLVSAVLVSFIWISSARAGSVQTEPPYDNDTKIISVGPNKSNGTTDVTFTVTSSDDTVNVNGTFANAPDASGSFTQDGDEYKNTVNYPITAIGQSSDVTITITTEDENGNPCTSSLWNRGHLLRRPLVGICTQSFYWGYLRDWRTTLWAITTKFGSFFSGCVQEGQKCQQIIKLKVLISKSQSAQGSVNLKAQ